MRGIGKTICALIVATALAILPSPAPCLADEAGGSGGETQIWVKGPKETRAKDTEDGPSMNRWRTVRPLPRTSDPTQTPVLLLAAPTLFALALLLREPNSDTDASEV